MLRNFSFSWFTFFFLALSSCATSPAGRRQFMLVSESRTNQKSERQFFRLKRTKIVETDEVQNRYVRCVVDAINLKLDRPQDWDVVLFRDDSANAFALPGGKIGVNTGLLRVAVNADQLAVVLGHEISHVVAQHGREQMSQQYSLDGIRLFTTIVEKSDRKRTAMDALATVAQVGLLYPFNRLQEIEADKIGLKLAAQAGFKPAEAIDFWHNMEVYGVAEPDKFFSSHPSHQARIENLQRELAELPPPGSLTRPNCEI